MQRRFLLILLFVLMWFASSQRALAHVGPPFPILTDREIPGHLVSIWADPDIGEALFYLVLEPREGQKAPAVSNVEFWVEPVNGRLPRKSYPVNQQKARRHLRFVATPKFDTQEFWRAGVEIKLGDGTAHSFAVEVESTPPGLGRWDLLVYIFPFVLFGGIWIMVMVRKARQRRARYSRGSATMASAFLRSPHTRNAFET